MSKTKIGFERLVDVIGKEFFEAHKSSAVFCHGEEDMGLWCFLGIDLHPENAKITLSASMDDWDVYASCFVTDDNEIIMDKCRLPQA